MVLDSFIRALDGFEAVLAGVAPGRWDVPSPWGGSMPLGGFLERYPMEILVHTWDLAQATGQPAALDADLVRDALGPARQFAPVARMSGLIGPECVVAEDADDLTRLLAIFGRRNPGD